MTNSILFKAVLAVLYLSLSACVSTSGQNNESSAKTGKNGNNDPRPNLLLILADDLGYTDLGVYGGEIETPNLDQLARSGLLLTDFHNQSVCAHTRASLLSGTDNHNAGGAMHQASNQRGLPGYESELNQDIVPLPELLKESGYNTYMAGKWHLGSESHQMPIARGFTRSFALLAGGASHYGDARGLNPRARTVKYVDGAESVEKLPDDFYSSDFYTDYIINAIDQDSKNQPWFAYLAFTAPHWPLQAPDEFIAKYKGRYDEGYQVLRTNRIAKGKELGVISAQATTYPKLGRVPEWSSLSEQEKKISTREMEIYAGMVDNLDKNVGRLIDYLKEIGEYDNTYIVFMSDNGAEGSARNPGDNGTDWTFDNSLENMGKVGSHIYYGGGWAQAGVGVSRYYKTYSSEGGTRGPAIIHHPQLSKAGQISDAFTSVVDIAPTFLELANVPHAELNSNGEPAQPIQGISMAPFTLGEAETVRPNDFVFGWEVFGHRAIRQGDWKLMRLTSAPTDNQPPVEGADQWELFKMSTDPGEVNDLSDQHPEIVAELLEHWEAYIAQNGIVLPEPDEE